MSSWWWIFKLLSGQKIDCSRDSEITNYFSRWCNEWITWCHVTPTSVPELTVVSEAPVVSTAPPPSTDKSPPLRRPRPLCCRHGDQWRGGWGRRRRGGCLWCRGRCGGRLQTETLWSHSWGERSPVSSRICLLLLLLLVNYTYTWFRQKSATQRMKCLYVPPAGVFLTDGEEMEGDVRRLVYSLLI